MRRDRVLRLEHEDSGEGWCCCFSPDGGTLAVGAELLLIFDLQTGELAVNPADPWMDAVTCCQYSTDGRTLATGGWDGALRLWNCSNWTCTASLPHSGSQVRGVAIAPGDGPGVVVATGAADCAVRVWRGGQCMAVMTGHTGPVNAVAFFPASQFFTRVASASDDMTVRTWDADRGEPLATLLGHTGPVTSCVVGARDQVPLTAPRQSARCHSPPLPTATAARSNALVTNSLCGMAMPPRS